MPNVTIRYGEIIKKLRKKHKMTQAELAEKIDLGKTSVSNYEIGYSIPSAQILEAISAVFDMSLVEFLVYDNEEMLSKLKLPRVAQAVNDTLIPFLKSENIRKDLIESESYMDSYLTLPGFMTETNSGYISIKMPDNSMEGEQIKRNDYLIIKKCNQIQNRRIALLINEADGSYLIRKCIKDGHVISLIPSSVSEKFPIVRTDEREEQFTVIGYVEKVIVSFN